MRRFVNGDRGTRRAFAAGCAAAFASPALVRAPAPAAQFEFKCGDQQTVDHPINVRMTQMFADIERESGGRMRIKLFPDNMLGGDAAMLTQVRVGALQLLHTAAGTLASVVPPAAIADIGYAFKDEDEARRVLTGQLGDFVRNDAATRGLHFIGYWGSGMKEVGSNSHPIRIPDDLHGFKIKSVGPMAIDLFKELGASPVPLSLAETYTGLQTHLIDGEDGPLLTLELSRFYEVNKYASLTHHAFSAGTFVMNGAVWSSLPPDLQAIVERNNRKYTQLEWRDTTLRALSVGEKLSRQGVTLNRVEQAAFRARLSAYYANWAGNFGPTQWGLLQNGLGRRLS